MKRFLIALALTASVLIVRTPSLASAQDIEVKGPLAGAPAVIGMRVYREMRFQIQAHGSLTLTDEFTQSVFFGGQLNFHPTDWLGIGVWGGFSPLHLDTHLTSEVSKKGSQNFSNVLSLPNAANFPKQIGKLQWIAAPQVTFIPLRGKLGIFESLFVDTDFYAFGGVGFVGLQERGAQNPITLASCPTNSMASLAQQVRTCQSTQKLESRMAVAPTFGVGLSLYMTDYLAMTMEWRALPFAWNTSGTNEVGNPLDAAVIDDQDRISHFNHLFTLGFAFYLPTEPGISYEEEGDSSSASASVSAGKKK